MKLNTSVILTGFVLLLVANVFMMYSFPYGVRGEGFRNSAYAPKAPFSNYKKNGEGFKNKNSGFSDYMTNPAGAKDLYQPMGAYDAVQIPTGNNESSWRYTAPNEPLIGGDFTLGPDSLFMFENNQCKPECCGSSFSCDGGCVCTTPQQRQYIASRGGNRTEPEDGV